MPSPKRRATAGPPQPRLTSGTAGPVWLGMSRVLRIEFGWKLRLGTVRAYHKPWYEVALDDGATLKLRGRDLASMLIFAPVDFKNPTFFY